MVFNLHTNHIATLKVILEHEKSKHNTDVQAIALVSKGVYNYKSLSVIAIIHVVVVRYQLCWWYFKWYKWLIL